MTDDRLLVAQAVMDGQIGQEHLTDAEIDEFVGIVVDAAIDKELERALERGCIVFSEVEHGLPN